MKGVENDHFWELAQKIMAGNASIGERAELDGLLADHPSLRAEFEQLRKDTLLAREFLPLLDAMEPAEAHFPERARERLSAKVASLAGLHESRARPEPMHAIEGNDPYELRLEHLLDAKSAQAMETACRKSGFTVDDHIRRRLVTATNEEAQDLAQRFFTWLFENKARIKAAFDPERGRHQSFLRVWLQRFINHDLANARAWRKHWNEVNRSENASVQELITKPRMRASDPEPQEDDRG